MKWAYFRSSVLLKQVVQQLTFVLIIIYFISKNISQNSTPQMRQDV